MSDDEDNLVIDEAEATTADTSTNFNDGISIDSPPPVTTTRNLTTNEPMLFSDERSISPRSLTRIFNSTCRKRSDESTLPMILDPPNLSSSSTPGPSNSSDVPGPSTSFPGFGSVDSTDDTENKVQQIRSLFTNADSLRIFDEHAADILSPIDMRPIDTPRRSGLNDTDTDNTSTVLSVPLDVENGDNNMLPIISLPRLDMDSINARDSHATSTSPTTIADNLFAPEESSSSSSGNPCLLRESSYFDLLKRHYSEYNEEFKSRYRPRVNKRFPRTAQSVTDPSELSTRTGSTQRLSYMRSRLMQTRFRLRHADLYSPRHRTTDALNTVASNEDGANITHGNNLRELNRRPYRRNIWGPNFSPERRFAACCITGTPECDPTISYSPFLSDTARSEAGLPNCRSAMIRSIINFGNSETLRPLSRPSTSNVRARSVSPTSASPNISASVHDEPLDDIAINLQSDISRDTADRYFGAVSEDEITRPDSPLPPSPSPTLTLSDDDDEMVELITVVPQSRAPPPPMKTLQELMTCQPMNLSMNQSSIALTNARSIVKEAPRTYEDLNSELIQLLECPICFEFTTPPINQCLQGHIVCNNCRQRVTTCPTCRTTFQQSRNLVMEKVAALLRYPCKNAVTGCMEFLYLLQKEQHEMSCGFRQYSCFLPGCKWRGYKPELLVHVQEKHENHVINGPSANLLIPVSGQSKKVWLMSAFNELFCVIFFTTLGIFKGCVRYIGDCSKCESYIYNISVTSEEDMLRNFNFSRMTHAYEENLESTEMMDSYDLFSISNAQLNLFRKGTKAPVRISIEHAQKRTGLTTPGSSSNAH